MLTTPKTDEIKSRYEMIRGMKVFKIRDSSFYPQQLEIIQKMLKCYLEGTNGLFESPTGTGKSVCILASVLAFQEYTQNRLSNMTSVERLANLVSLYPPASIDPLDQSDDGIGTQGSAPAAQPQPQLPLPIVRRQFFITSRTQKQLEQLIKSFKAIKKERHDNPILPDVTCTSAVLGSRAFMCIHPDKKEWDTSELNDNCRGLVTASRAFENALQNSRRPISRPRYVCDHFLDRSKLSSDSRFTSDIWDIEDIVEAGKMHQSCPYYASKDLSDRADVTFAPYNYIIDPKISRTKKGSSQPKIIIIDEAHNIESNCCESASVDLMDVSLLAAEKFLNSIGKYVLKKSKEADRASTAIADPSNGTDLGVPQPVRSAGTVAEHYQYTTKAVSAFVGLCEDYEDYCEKLGDYKKWTGPQIAQVLIDDFKLTHDYAESIRSEREASYTLEKFPEYARLQEHENVVENIADFLDYILNPETQEHFHVVLQMVEQDNGVVILTLSLWCMNSAILFAPLERKSHSVILMSGTLAPLNSFAKELDTVFSQSSQCRHVIQPHQFQLITIPSVPSGGQLIGTRGLRTSDTYITDLGASLIDAASIIPNGLLVFIQSYDLLSNFTAHWKKSKVWATLCGLKHVTIEPRNNIDGQHDTAISTYKNNCVGGTGALLFAVYRGRSSEGMDFRDEQCRGVVLVSIPYANIGDLKVSLNMQYHDQHSSYLLKGNEWLRAQAFRALNQSLGRAIRHKKDWGVALLFDTRFIDEYKGMLPVWTRVHHGHPANNYAEYKRDLEEFVANRQRESRAAEDSSPVELVKKTDVVDDDLILIDDELQVDDLKLIEGGVGVPTVKRECLFEV